MNRKILLLNLALACLAAVLVWQLSSRWKSAQRRIEQVRAQNVPPPRVLPPPVTEPPKPAAPAEYLDIAQKTLFARDRNPNVIVEPPPPAAKQAGVPDLGNDMGGGLRGCAAGDTSPAGTVVSGYRKVVSRSLMGSSCYWEQVK